MDDNYNLTEYDTNRFRLSIRNKRDAFKVLRAVFDEFNYKFVQKLGDYNVFEAVGLSPIKRWSSGKVITPTEGLDEEVFLYYKVFSASEMTNRGKRSDLYRLFVRDAYNYEKKVVNGQVTWRRIDYE